MRQGHRQLVNRPWQFRPPVGAEANRRLIDQGLVALFDLSSGTELISGQLGTNTAVDSATRYGAGRDYSGTANTQFAHRAQYAQTGPITLFACVEIDALSNYTAIIAKQETATRNASFEFRIGNAYPGEAGAFLLRADGTNYAFHQAGATTVSAGYRGVIAITSNSGTLSNGSSTIYWDGGSRALGAISGGSGCSDNGAAVWIGRRIDGGTQLDGRNVYVGVVNRVWPVELINRLIAQPGLAYEPKRIWVPFSAAAAGGGFQAAWASSSNIVLGAGVH